MIFFGHNLRKKEAERKKKEEERRAAGGIVVPPDAADKLEAVIVKAFDAWQSDMKELELGFEGITLREIRDTERDLIAGVRRTPKKWKRKKGFIVDEQAKIDLNDLLFAAFGYIFEVVDECETSVGAKPKILLGRCETSIRNGFEELIFNWAE